MTEAELGRRPWLMLEHEVLGWTGYSRVTLSKLVECGVLAAVQPAGVNHRRYRKVQVAALLGVTLEGRDWAREPWLLTAKQVTAWTGFSGRLLDAMVRAGGLTRVRPPGSGKTKYRKTEVGGWLGMEKGEGRLSGRSGRNRKTGNQNYERF